MMASDRHPWRITCLFSLLVLATHVQRSAGANEETGGVPRSSQYNEPVSATAQEIQQEYDDETLLRGLVERFPRMGYFTLTNIGQLLDRGRPLLDALLDALDFRVKIQRMYLTRPQVSHLPRERWTKADLYNGFQEFISRPCADIKSLNLLFEQTIVQSAESKATFPGITTEMIEDLKQLHELCLRIEREVSIKAVFDKLKSQVSLSIRDESANAANIK